MNIENHVLTAIEIVSNWCLSDDCLADAISAQAMHMAGMNLDDFWEDQPDIH